MLIKQIFIPLHLFRRLIDRFIPDRRPSFLLLFSPPSFCILQLFCFFFSFCSYLFLFFFKSSFILSTFIFKTKQAVFKSKIKQFSSFSFFYFSIMIGSAIKSDKLIKELIYYGPSDSNDQCTFFWFGVQLIQFVVDISIQIYLMSGQGSGSARSFSSGNAPQAQQAPQQAQQQQPDPMFAEGQALFARLQENRIQQLENFKKLNDVQMTSQIGSLQFWSNRGGPQNQDETQKSRIFLQDLKKYEHQEMRRVMKHGLLGKWISKLYQRLLSQLNFSTEKQSVQYGLGCQSSYSFGQLKNLSIGADEAEYEETRPLKQQ